MIEKTILDYLEDNNLTCYMERPSTPPEKYLILQKTGSKSADFITTTTLAIQSYAPSLYEASELNEKVKKAMDKADILIPVSASALVSDYNFTNTSAKQYRYQAVYEITHKE